MNDYFLIAEIKSAFGADGYMSVESFSDFNGRFLTLKKVVIEVFGNKKEFLVDSVKEVEKGIILKLTGFNSENDVGFLIGKKVFVERDDSVKLPKDVFYIHDLLGSNVFRDHSLIGTVEDVLVLPANDVLVINDLNGRKIMLPMIKDYIDNFDPENKSLVLVSGCDLLYDDEN